MDRRSFLRQSMLLPAQAGGLALLAGMVRADELPRDLRITRVLGFVLPTKRPKFVGKNSQRDVHGDRGADRMIRVETNAGIEGIGACNANQEVVAKLLGARLSDLYRATDRRMSGPLDAGTMALWDLAGKALGQPVYKLLGGAGHERVPVYDGSIYFVDLLPQYGGGWKDQLKREIDAGLAAGHRALKVKIGRGKKWMPRAEGDARDVEVVRLIRAHGGDDLTIGVDANNGYDLEGAKRFLRAAGELNLAFAEEMFEERVEPCLELKRFIAERGWKTLLADGETQSRLEAYKPLIAAGAIDVLQGDMKHFGFEGILTEAAWAAPKGIRVAPHNWGSLIGYYMQLHVGRAIPNFYMAEHDPLATEVLVADGYEIRDGKASVPDAPGFGLGLNETKFASEIRVDFDLKE